MSRLRLFVLWIALFAVPFQGYAAATMAFCGPAHASATGGTATSEMMAMPEATGLHDGHQGHAGHAAHAGHDMHGGDHATAHQAAGADDHGTSTHADAAHKCGTCGACHATALITLLQTVVPHDLPPADLAEPSFAMATLVPRVLDKPPRA